jgi:hypothetical protein
MMIDVKFISKGRDCNSMSKLHLLYILERLGYDPNVYIDTSKSDLSQFIIGIL